MYTLGIDIGTSGTKTVLFDRCGKKIASATVEYPLHQPRNGWAEQNPSDWWYAVCRTVRVVTENIAPEEIVGIGLSGQMHGLVMLDDRDRVLRPAILWCDGRTGAECAEIERRLGRERLIAVTANPALAGFTASKILWVQKNEPDIWAKCRRILLPKDYIRFMLTGEYATEVSDASGMQLLDVPGRCWSQEVLDALEIRENQLGKVYESPQITGFVTPEAAALCRLKAGIPVVGGAGDNAAAAVGLGVVRDGRAFTTVGTSGVVFAHTDHISIDPEGRVHTFCCAVPGAWHVMGVTQAAGLSLRWMRDTFCEAEREEAMRRGCDPYDIMTEEAKNCPIGAERLLYLPYLMGERTPHLDPMARGAFVGLSAVHTRAHMIRAVMEGVRYSLFHCVEILPGMHALPDEMQICGGGGKSAFWRQMLADAFGMPVVRAASDEGPALGVAILAMVGAGMYPDVRTACDSVIAERDRTLPDAAAHAEYRKYYEIYTSLYGSLKDGFARLGSC